MKLLKHDHYIWILLIFIYMFFLNYFIPFYADDYSYSFIFGTSEKLAGVLDVFYSQYIHYFSWGGRTVSHTIGQLLLLTSSKLIIAILNSLVFVMLILLMSLHINWSKHGTKRGVLILAILFFCWTCIPVFGETTVWLIGSVNYLWTTAIILLFLIPYRRLMFDSIYYESSFIMTFYMFFLGIVAGWTNENTGLSMIGIAFFMMFYLYKKNRLSSWTISGLVGSIIGFMFLIFAPGNGMRSKVFEQSEDYSFFLNHIKVPFNVMIEIMKLQYPIWILLLFLLLIIIFQAKRRNIYFKQIMRNNSFTLIISSIFIFFSIVNNLLMFASPYFPLRAGFGSSIFLIIGVLTITNVDIICQTINNWYTRWLSLLGILFLIVSMTNVFNRYYHISLENEERINSINHNKNLGIKSIVVEPFSLNENDSNTFNGHVFVRDIGSNPNVWPNTDYANYFNINSIQVKLTQN